MIATRTGASGHHTKNLAQRFLHELDLLVELVILERAHVRVVPGVRTGLVRMLVCATEHQRC
jgi:hypothetical protein